jgi:hypothetical protein
MIPYRMHTHFLGHHIVNGTQNRVLEHAYLPTSPISKSLFKTRLIFFSFVAFPMHFSKIIGSYFACLRLKKGYYSWINLQICVGLYKGPMYWDWSLVRGHFNGMLHPQVNKYCTNDISLNIELFQLMSHDLNTCAHNVDTEMFAPINFEQSTYRSNQA